MEASGYLLVGFIFSICPALFPVLIVWSMLNRGTKNGLCVPEVGMIMTYFMGRLIGRLMRGDVTLGHGDRECGWHCAICSDLKGTSSPRHFTDIFQKAVEVTKPMMSTG